MQAMQEGQTIKHGVYGLGVVTASDQERTAVDFDDHGPKLFVTSIMTAELIGEAMGFKHVEAGPLVRSSYHAFEQTESASR